MQQLLSDLRQELELREQGYKIIVEQAVRLLQDDGSRSVSTHLGHNLASRANELSVAASRIETVKELIRYAEARLKVERPTVSSDLCTELLTELVSISTGTTQREIAFRRTVRDHLGISLEGQA